MDSQSLDITAEKMAQLRAIFPEVFSEDKVDFARLKDVLGESVAFPNEHYELSWAGKAEARREIQTQTTATLIPDKENSINFSATGNIFIEGENLEVLRVLQKSYFGKVKMIYIDPPYNTGNDSFVYPDDYAERQDEYNKRTGKTNGAGYLNKQDLWRKNSRESGQFHSVWLSMMYPRLYLARNLLREDGLIFVSIDDNEAANLKLLMDEIFGAENFKGQIARATGTPTGQGTDSLVNEKDYMLVYAKSDIATFAGLIFDDEDEKRYDQEDKKGRYLIRPLRKTGGEDRREDRPTMFFAIIDPDGGEVFPIGPGGYESRWRCGPSTYEELLNSGLVEWRKVKDTGSPIWRAYQKFYMDGRTKQPSNLWTDIEGNKKASRDLVNIFGEKIFDFPKPIELIKQCCQITNGKDSLIVDFFAGSGTTAQAVLELNEEDGGNRRFICVQMPEYLEEGSEGKKAGYNTIADICRARIQKVIKKMQIARAAELELEAKQALGFQAFRLATSNFKQWRGDVTGEDILKQLEIHIHSEKEDSEAEKMLYELLLKAGYSLTAKVESVEIEGQVVYTVEDGKMLLFFDSYSPAINAYVLRNQRKPQRVVCLDRVFKGNDEAVTNFKLQLKEADIELTII